MTVILIVHATCWVEANICVPVLSSVTALVIYQVEAHFAFFFAFGSNGILKFAFSKNVQNCPGVYRTSILRLRKASNFAVSAKLKDSGKY